VSGQLRESGREIARQLKLRNIGGRVIIDFIDHWSEARTS